MMQDDPNPTPSGEPGPRFVPPREAAAGTVANLLERSYAGLLIPPTPIWEQERRSWAEFDREVFAHPDTVGACVFLTLVGGRPIGFGSYDPRGGPDTGIVGHNCVLPAFRGRGHGKRQVLEILRRLRALEIRAAKASTLDHEFFRPAQQTYLSCGFREVRRERWAPDPTIHRIDYERLLG